MHILVINPLHLHAYLDCEYNKNNIFISFTVDGQIAFWPPTEEHQGKNLIPGGTDVQLEGVVFTGNTGPWKSIPAYFAGSASSYATGTGDDLLITRDFSFMAAVYLEQGGEGLS